MHVSINSVSQFYDQFRRMNRTNHFTYDALGLLYDFLTELDGAAELDVVAICCEYSEDTEKAIAASYGLHEDEDVTAFLEENTLVVGVTSSGNVVYQQF